jgi:hypothetical protein
MIMAGLWDPWKSPDGWVRSCTIITTDANELLASVHDRMPVVLSPDDFAPWLGEEPATGEQLKAMPKPYPSERLAMWPVDRRVGNVKNEGPELAGQSAARVTCDLAGRGRARRQRVWGPRYAAHRGKGRSAPIGQCMAEGAVPVDVESCRLTDYRQG